MTEDIKEGPTRRDVLKMSAAAAALAGTTPAFAGDAITMSKAEWKVVSDSMSMLGSAYQTFHSLSMPHVIESMKILKGLHIMHEKGITLEQMREDDLSILLGYEGNEGLVHSVSAMIKDDGAQQEFPKSDWEASFKWFPTPKSNPLYEVQDLDAYCQEKWQQVQKQANTIITKSNRTKRPLPEGFKRLATSSIENIEYADIVEIQSNARALSNELRRVG